MSRWKAALTVFICITLILPHFVTVCHAEKSDALSVSAQSAVLIEAESGTVIYSKNADTPLPMASTTKIMTALTALELASPNTEIAADAAAVGIEGSSVYLVENEKLTLEQLLYALMLESANDAAAAIAIGLCGSIEAFAKEMNRKATDIGLKQTHFTNPHGLDDENHYTTAYELAVITRYALNNDLFRQIVSTRKTTIPHADSEADRLLVNHNKLLRQYDGCIGVKTGFTKRSGRCLVSAAERDGVTVIAVTLNAPNDWDDHTALLDYGFSCYQSVLLCKKEQYLFPVSVVNGAEQYIMVRNPEELRVTLPSGYGTVTQSVEIDRFLYATVAEGELLGQVVFRCDINGDGTAEIIGTSPLVACYAVAKQQRQKNFWQWLKDIFFSWFEK